MLKEIQILRLLHHCQNADLEFDKAWEKGEMCPDGDPTHHECLINRGWIRALELVLEDSSFPISTKPIEEEH